MNLFLMQLPPLQNRSEHSNPRVVSVEDSQLNSGVEDGQLNSEVEVVDFEKLPDDDGVKIFNFSPSHYYVTIQQNPEREDILLYHQKECDCFWNNHDEYKQQQLNIQQPYYTKGR